MKMRLMILLGLGLGLPSYTADEAQKKEIIQEILYLHESIHVMVLAAGHAAGEPAEMAAGGAATEAIRNAVVQIVAYFDASWDLSDHAIFETILRAAVMSADLEQPHQEAIVAKAVFEAMTLKQVGIKASILEGIKIIKIPDIIAFKAPMENLLDVDAEGLNKVVYEIKKYYVDRVLAVLKMYLKIANIAEYAYINKRFFKLVTAVLPPELWPSYQVLGADSP